MTIEQIIPVAIQLPIVFLFIWYNDRKDAQFRDFMREERAAREKQDDAFIKELNRNTETMNEFRREVNAAIMQMKDRTAHRP